MNSQHEDTYVHLAPRLACSLIDRRAEENGVSEASSPIHENVGFMAYNALAGVTFTPYFLHTHPLDFLVIAKS